MIKRLLFLSFLSAIFVVKSYSQCTPDPNCNAEVCPDTIDNLDTAYTGLMYEQIITLNVPADTTLSGIYGTIDSLVLSSVNGLPSGISHVCNAANCVMLGGQKYCIKLSGVPNIADTGLNELTMQGTIYGTAIGSPILFPYPITGYRIYVVNASSIKEKIDLISKVSNVPNPFSNSTEVFFSSKIGGKADFLVYNLLGRNVHTETIQVNPGQNSFLFEADKLPSGIYMYSLRINNSVVTKRMIIK
jgi:hypothetical protein